MRAQERVADRYELTYPLGHGGMGEVWGGFDEKLDRPVAIKFLRKLTIPENERDNAVERFMREARVTARLDHPGVPSVHDVGHHGDDVYIVMQLVPGLLLSDLIAERGRLAVPWAAAIGAQICSVLAVAHAASLVHRDLKPQNLMVTPTGSVKVLDFGVAALLGPDVPRLTATSHTLGTPTYMAPEQALNSAVGPRADLYALGCVLFELLTGEPPYRADSALGLLHRHMNDPIPSVTDHRAGVPDGLVRLVGRLLAKDPQDRPGSAAEVYELLAPLGVVAPGLAGDLAVTVADGQSVDPTMPHRYPFGPLPPRTPPAPTRVDIVRPRSAPEVVESLSLDKLTEAEERAWELAEEERFTQAAELLETALRPLRRGHGAKQPRVLELRLNLANLYVLAGAFRQALPEFQRLIPDLAERPVPDHELIWQCRQQAAVCQAELGEATEALSELGALLAEQQQVMPADSPQLFPLRQQIAMLAASIGDVASSRNGLKALLHDMRRLHGTHPPVVEIEALLTHLDRLTRDSYPQ
ncbi:serine/threonine protein kinase [Micromonospora purpureochromogenes]|uniref:non-specific serine/threonine protein kinase n=1 Tax=Micromonospora purpureochromogenes TaxID=47872 RepID=A0A1C4YF16_9ACTN|nr:serine/threonine-protein kinase [Micromonospora purpureochromogenes]SCF19315.1 serine/threonine protein kinase [Micromonospora purpureochromogenes]